MMKNSTFLAADIGGTKTILNVFSYGKKFKKLLADHTLESDRFSSLEALLADYLASVKIDVKQAVFGVAGPVVDGKAHISNLPWVIIEKKICQTLNFNVVKIINDLEATARALPALSPKDIYTINKGNSQSQGNKAVIAPGTGLGEVFLSWHGSGYSPHASEGGHADFGPNNSVEIELLQYLLGRYDHVSCERVCSGPGIYNIYNFIKDHQHQTESGWVAEQIQSSSDPVPVIISAALDKKRACPVCVKTLQIFSAIFGAEAGNLALRILATAGVYLGGGLPPRILPFLIDGPFFKAFHQKGRMQKLLKNIPVYVIQDPNAALVGTALYGFDYFRELEED
jgi:glucokinase